MNVVRNRVVQAKLQPYQEKTKFVLDALIDCKQYNGGSTITPEVIKEVNQYLCERTRKKTLQVIDDIRWGREQEQAQKQEENNQQLFFNV